MAHVIVVGGTGMLRNVSLFLAKHDNTVSVVALEREALNSLKEEAAAFGGRINPIVEDYTSLDKFTVALRQAIRLHGPVTLAIVWMHPDALPEAANLLVEEILRQSPVCRYFQILPSAGIQEKDSPFLDNPYREHHRLLYRKVILGYKVENGMRQLLSDEEVANGVIKAVRDDDRSAVLGELESTPGSQIA